MARKRRAQFDIIARDRTKQGFDSASNRAQKTADKIVAVGRAAAGALAVFGGGRAIRGVLQSTAQISEMGDVADISAERIQELTKSFSDMAGVSESITQGGLRRFNRRLDLAREGTGAAVDTLDKLNISLEQDTQSALDAAIRKLQQLAETESITGEASQLFGEDAGPKMAAALAQGSEALDQQIAKLREQGRVLSNESVQGARRANDRLSELSDTLSSNFASRIAENAESIEVLAEAIFTLTDTFVLTPADWFVEFGEALGFLAGRIVNGPILDSIPKLEDKLKSLKEERSELRDEFEGKQDLDIFQRRMEKLDGEINTVGSRLEMARNQVERMNGPIDVAASNVRTLNEEFSALENAFPDFQEPALEVRTLTEEFQRLQSLAENRAMDVLNQGIEDIRDEANPGRAELRQFREQVDSLNRAVERGIIGGAEATQLRNTLMADLSDSATEVRTLRGEMQRLDEAAQQSGRGSSMSLDAIREDLRPEEDRIRERFERRREIVRQNLSEESSERVRLLDRLQEQEAQKVQEHESSMQRLQLGSRRETLRGISGVFGNLSQLMEDAGQEQTTIAKRMAQAQAVTNAATAITNALAVPPPPVGFALAGTMAATTAAQIARIEGAKFASGGPVVGPGTSTSDSIPARLSNGEHVLSADDVSRLGGHGAVERLRKDAGRERRINAGGGSGSGGAPQVSVTNVFNVEANDTGGSVEQQLAQLAPMIEQISRQSVLKAIEGGGPLSRAVGRRPA